MVTQAGILAFWARVGHDATLVFLVCAAFLAVRVAVAVGQWATSRARCAERAHRLRQQRYAH